MADTKVDSKNGQFVDPMAPMSSIPDDALIYVVNSSPSNKVLKFNNERQILTAPGHLGSVQLVSKKMMATPGFMALWTTGKIQVSLSADVGKSAVSEAQMNMVAEQKRIHEMRQNITEDTGNGVAGDKVSDVSDKAKDFESGAPTVTDTSDSPLNVVSEPRKGGRRKKTTPADGNAE